MSIGPKSALHHWWPQSVSGYWADREGQVSQVNPDGGTRTAPPSNFGAITNAHHIKFGGIWDHSIEPIFDSADSKFHDYVSYLESFDFIPLSDENDLEKRIIHQRSIKDFSKEFAECISSLIVRSPRFRNSIKIFVNEFRPPGLAIGRNDNLYAANIGNSYRSATDSVASCDGILIIYSGEEEFIYGDGQLSNIPIAPGPFLSLKCVVHITPRIGVIPIRLGRYVTKPKIMSLFLSCSEVIFFNEIIQIYSKDQVFYRYKRPNLIPAFQRREFLEYEYNSHPWLDYLIEIAARSIPRS